MEIVNLPSVKCVFVGLWVQTSTVAEHQPGALGQQLLLVPRCSWSRLLGSSVL